MKLRAFISAALTLPMVLLYSQSYDVELDMSNPEDWTIDVVHLGSRQIEISYDAGDNAVVMQPTWSENDASSSDLATRNIENGRLHSIQYIK